MNINISAKALRSQTKGLLAAVARGEEIVISFRGKPTAKVIPLHGKPRIPKKHTSVFGIWKDRKDIGDPSAYVANLRKARFS